MVAYAGPSVATGSLAQGGIRYSDIQQSSVISCIVGFQLSQQVGWTMPCRLQEACSWHADISTTRLVSLLHMQAPDRRPAQPCSPA